MLIKIFIYFYYLRYTYRQLRYQQLDIYIKKCNTLTQVKVLIILKVKDITFYLLINIEEQYYNLMIKSNQLKGNFRNFLILLNF